METQEADKLSVPQRTGTLLLWLSGALAFGLFITMAIHASSLSPGIPALQLTFNKADFNAILSRWGPAGVALFRAHFQLDFPLLLSYGLFGYLLVRYGCLFRQLDKTTRQIAGWTLPAAAVLDAIENLLHLHLITEPATHAPSLYLMAGLVASSKWLLIATFMAAALYLVIDKWRHGCAKWTSSM